MRRVFGFGLLTSCALCVGCGSDEAPSPAPTPGFGADNSHLPDELRSGKWAPATGVRAPQLDAEQMRAIEELNAIGYADGVRPAPELVSVTVHEADRAQSGYNLFTSGHASEAYLVDMEGGLLHRWSYDYERLWPGHDVPVDAAGRSKWRRAYMLEDGGLLAIHEGIGLICLDRASRLVWEYPGRTHHDLHVLPDGRLWTLGREASLIERVNPDVPSMDDYLVLLSAAGEELRRLSVLECLENGGAEELLASMPKRMELFHTNSIEVLDGRAVKKNPAFADGNLLLSLRHLNALVVVDPERGAVVWSHTGAFVAQHDAKILSNGNLLLFDNRGRGEASTVYELDVASGDVVWEYRGTPAEPFYSKTCGTAYRLENGNTLINESDGGRSFEVTADGEIVWEFFNPNRGGEALEYIACLYDLERVARDRCDSWLER